MTQLLIQTNFMEKAEVFRIAAAGTQRLLEAGMERMGDDIGDLAVPIFKENAPVLSGQLRDKMFAEHHSDLEGLTVTIGSKAESAQGFLYANAEAYGHRIVAWGHDTGRYTEPDPYVPESLDQLEAPMHAAMRERARLVTEGVVHMVAA